MWRKKFILTILSYFGYLLEPVVHFWLVIFSPFCKIWQNEVHFSPPKKSPLYLLKSYFSGQEKRRNCFSNTPPCPHPQKNTARVQVLHKLHSNSQVRLHGWMEPTRWTVKYLSPLAPVVGPFERGPHGRRVMRCWGLWFRPSSYLKRCDYCLNCVSLFFRHLSKSTSSLDHVCGLLTRSLGWGSISYLLMLYVVFLFFRDWSTNLCAIRVASSFFLLEEVGLT
jgi:hypothetical protein